jgi:hypothetical protein
MLGKVKSFTTEDTEDTEFLPGSQNPPPFLVRIAGAPLRSRANFAEGLL